MNKCRDKCTFKTCGKKYQPPVEMGLTFVAKIEGNYFVEMVWQMQDGRYISAFYEPEQKYAEVLIGDEFRENWGIETGSAEDFEVDLSGRKWRDFLCEPWTDFTLVLI